jgi:hypothetical protein
VAEEFICEVDSGEHGRIDKIIVDGAAEDFSALNLAYYHIWPPVDSACQSYDF